MVKNRLQCRRLRFYSWVRKIPWRRDGLPILVFLGLPSGSAGKETACIVGDLGSIPGLGRTPEGGHGNLLQYSCVENPHGLRSLEGYSPWGHKESDSMELTHKHILRKLPFMGNVVLDVFILSNSLLSRKLFLPEESQCRVMSID